MKTITYHKVSDYLLTNYSMAVGGNFDSNNHINHKFNCEGINLEVHPGVNIKNNTISFITIRYKTNEWSELIKVFCGLKKKFQFEETLEIDDFKNISDVYVKTLGTDIDSKFELKLLLWDKVRTLDECYEIELKIEKMDSK